MNGARYWGDANVGPVGWGGGGQTDDGPSERRSIQKVQAIQVPSPSHDIWRYGAAWTGDAESCRTIGGWD